MHVCSSRFLPGQEGPWTLETGVKREAMQVAYYFLKEIVPKARNNVQSLIKIVLFERRNWSPLA